ncbi:DmpA family aminopeptidase [Secundilactobacillus oryzae]|nr:P1 family peptidase [Secundilactobacillus oryzae]
MGLKNRQSNDVSTGRTGRFNLITDVPGVQVGHTTIDDGNVHTGVTAILPQTDNVFLQKLPAATHVINGFGKSAGLVQIEELGTLETPLVLTNTFGVGTALNALTKAMLAQNSDIGDTTSTVNPVILECNDGDVSDIRKMAIQETDVTMALENSATQFEEGAVGAGRGMMCYDLKGGIGSSSRLVDVDQQQFTIGTLVMSNFGFLRDLVIAGESIGQLIFDYLKQAEKKEEHGSIITIVATDAPLDARQLKRLAKRASVGITRTGSFIGHGSGEIVVAFSTANRVAHYPQNNLESVIRYNDDKIDQFFRSVVGSVDESVRSSLVHAESVVDRKGKLRMSLPAILEKMSQDETINHELITKVQQELGLI